ncbi:MAG: hypothetical protein ACLTIG_13670 [Roseburia hominis]
MFVDECHRTQSGKLHTAMKTIMPNAVFIGFTGTPLLKRDKKISIEVFGTYIHAYKYNEGVLTVLFWIFVMNTAMFHRICLHRIVLTSGST